VNTIRAALGLPRQTPPIAVSRSILGRFLGQRSGRAGLILAALVLVTVFAGPFLVPYDPDQIDLPNKLAPPDAEHWLGTDQFGRDQLSRLLNGGRRSLGAALIVLASVLTIGLVVGITAGMAGGGIDAVLMRIVDVLLALPSLILALAIVGVLGVGFQNLLLALVSSWWAYYARLARSYVLAARQRQDVIADRLAGIGWPRIVVGHILPGVLTQMLIVVTLDLGGIIISIAGLSFLGLGVQPPDAEWGAMLSTSRLYFSTAPWLLTAPAVAIFLSVVASNLIGNALRDAAGSRRVQ
jgi:ABC-type dipeptide/oligopeptide/nickel transport system permease subunit